MSAHVRAYFSSSCFTCYYFSVIIHQLIITHTATNTNITFSFQTILLYFVSSGRFVSRSWSCAWGSFLSSDTCRLIRTGPTSSLIHKLTRSVLSQSLHKHTLLVRYYYYYHYVFTEVFPFHIFRLHCWILELRGGLIRVSLTPTLRWEAFIFMVFV